MARACGDGPDARRRIVVAGGGMVGMKFAAAMSDLDAAADVRVIGDEPAYDRTQLIHLLDGTRSRAAVMGRSAATPGRIVAIDRPGKSVCVSTPAGETIAVAYDILVLATGARPLRPDVAGIDKAFTLRRLDDAERVIALDPGSAIIVGAGALGLELADALSTRGCRVTVLNAADRIMERHLDAATAAILQAELEAAGIRFVLGASLSRVGQDFVDLGGTCLQADLVLLAAGVLPDDDLARAAGLQCDRGVVVDDDMRTSDASIYAIGDCVRHGGQAHCQLHHGYQQAYIAAKAIAGDYHWAPQESPAIILKTRCRAFLIGRPQGDPVQHRSSRGLRRFWLQDDRIVGAAIIGPWEKIPLLRQAVDRGAAFSLRNRVALRITGDPWPLRSQNPAQWPGDAIVCQCHEVSLAAAKNAVAAGAATVDDIGRACAAGTGCGGCRPLLARVLGAAPAAAAYHRALLFAAAVALAASLLVAFGGIPYSPSFAWRWDLIWRDFTAKQISGFALLATAVVLVLTGMSRHSEAKPAAAKGAWRAAHAVAGALAVAGLLLHSGGHLGQGIALLLSLAWVGALLFGAALALVFARAHVTTLGPQSPAGRAARWLHLFFLWPLPVLLAYHVAGAYLWH